MSRADFAPFVQHYKTELPAGDESSFDGFAALVGPMFNLQQMDHQVQFHASVAVTMLPDIYLTHSIAAGSRYVRDEKVIARSGTDAIVLLVYLAGEFVLQIDGRTETVASGDLVFLDLRQPVCIEAAHVDNLSLVISRQRLEVYTNSVQDLHGFVLRAGAMRDLLLAHLRACAEAGPRLPAADAAGLSDLTIRMVALSLSSLTRRAALSGRHARKAPLAEIKRFIESHLGREDLSPDLILSAFGVSRATLYRLFEPHGGVSNFILERRLWKALETLSARNHSAPRLQELARDLGFRHPSVFSRAFKRQFGVSPQTVRLRQNPPPGAVSQPWRVPSAAEVLLSPAHAARSTR